MWWQGSVISGSELVGVDSGVELLDFYLVASQTCAIQSVDFTKVPKVELVGATVVPAVDEALKRGWNPRLLHVKLENDDENEVSLALEIKLQDRRWIDRRLLAGLAKSDFTISGDSNLPGRTVFARWLGGSYTRMELPDEFNEALKKAKIQSFISERLAGLKDKVFGIYFEVSESSSDSDDPVSPEEMALLRPPYDLEFNVVNYRESDREAVVKELKKLFAPTIPSPHRSASGDGPEEKISRATLAERCGVRILGGEVNVATVSSWRTSDLMRTVRYTEIDYLSGTEGAVGD